jgi:hypothetical protein
VKAPTFEAFVGLKFSGYKEKAGILLFAYPAFS